MTCLDDDVSRIICAINENASVRPYDLTVLYIALISIVATLGISLILWLFDKRASLRQSRSDAIESIISLIDRVDVSRIAHAKDKKNEFDDQISYSMKIFRSFFVLDRKNVGLLALIEGQVEYAGLRINGVSATNAELQVKQKLLELYSDMHNMRVRWEFSSNFRKKVKKFQNRNKLHFANYIPWDKAIEIANS